MTMNRMWQARLVVPMTALSLVWAGSVNADMHGDDKSDDKAQTEMMDESSMDAQTREEREEEVSAARTALEAADERIDRAQEWLDENWDELDDAARERAREAMNTLREQRTKAAEWFGSLRHASQERWEDTKEGFARAYEALQASWERSKAQLRDDEESTSEPDKEAGTHGNEKPEEADVDSADR